MSIREKLLNPPPVLGMVLIIVGVFIGDRAMRAYTERNSLPVDQQVASAVANINKDVPKQIDPETELIGAESSGTTITYNTRLVNLEAAAIDLDIFSEKARELVIKGVCSDRAIRGPLLKRGVTMRYAWQDRNRHPITKIDVIETDCGPESGRPLSPLVLGIVLALTWSISGAVRKKTEHKKTV